MTIAANNPPEIETILDAAEAHFAEVGVRLTTINDIARRAGVGRATIYRRIGGRDEVAHAVTTRSAARLIDDIAAVAESAATIDELVGDVFATTVERMRQHPVWNRMLALDAPSALPRLTTDGAEILAAATQTATEILQRAADAGLLADVGDLAGRAEVVVRLAHSVILTPRALTPLETHEQLAAFARAHLVPVIVSSDRRP
jgi:AcrR family transcriptional regulator